MTVTGLPGNTGTVTIGDALGAMGTINNVGNNGIVITDYPNVTIQNMEINAGGGNAVQVETATGFVGDSTVDLIDNLIMGDSGAKVFIGAERFASACSGAAKEVDLPAEALFSLGSIPGFRPFSDLKDGRPDTTPDDRLAGHERASLLGRFDHGEADAVLHAVGGVVALQLCDDLGLHGVGHFDEGKSVGKTHQRVLAL